LRLIGLVTNLAFGRQRPVVSDTAPELPPLD
jgi:hypothetical protein